jgi:hypothetical protein
VDNDCPRCAENERQVAELREKITELDVTVDQPTNLADNDLERELAGWLSWSALPKPRPRPGASLRRG